MSELNDPRVFFAAERTLLAWNRTALTLMTFGFFIERSSLLIHASATKQADISFCFGVAFILLGALAAFASIAQYRSVLKTLKPVEIPEGYSVNAVIFANVAVGLLGIGLSVYLFLNLVS